MNPLCNLVLVISVSATFADIQEFKVNIPSRKCTYGGVEYEPGDDITTGDPCTRCKCTGTGYSACAVSMCARPNCADFVQSPDVCCAQCPNGYTTCRAGDVDIPPNGGLVRRTEDGCFEVCSCGYPVSSLEARCTKKC